MSKITIKIKDYNKLDLLARARLSTQEVGFEVDATSFENRALARRKQVEAIEYIGDSRVLVNVNFLNHVYNDLVVLAYEAGHIAEVYNHITLKVLQSEISAVSFGYARCFGELDRLIREGKK